MSQQEKDKSHARIVASASRLFRKRGLEGASVGEVMKDAGLTHGGFYKHFESKDALIESAIEASFSGFAQALAEGDAQEAYAAYRALYLSEDHLNHPEIGCPVATLGQEVSRGPAGPKTALGAGVQRLIGVIARSKSGTAHAKRTAAIREFSMMVGAMVIARASDDETASEVLSACRKGARHV